MTGKEMVSAAALISGGSPTIYVSDLNRAVEFYSRTLGLKVAYRAGDHFCMIDGGKGLMIGLHPAGATTPQPGTRGSIELGLNVAQPIAEVVRMLGERRVRFQSRDGKAPISNDGAVKLAFFSDPDGNALYLCEVGR